MPVFDGMNPDFWIVQAEQYGQSILEQREVGGSNYQLRRGCSDLVLWEEMKLLLLNRFRSKRDGTLQEQKRRDITGAVVINCARRDGG